MHGCGCGTPVTPVIIIQNPASGALGLLRAAEGGGVDRKDVHANICA